MSLAVAVIAVSGHSSGQVTNLKITVVLGNKILIFFFFFFSCLFIKFQNRASHNLILLLEISGFCDEKQRSKTCPGDEVSQKANLTGQFRFWGFSLGMP
jgi:hypothetical protein